MRADLASRLAERGVTVAISTLGDSANVRTLRQRVGVAIANGLPWERALAAVTTVPAQLYGLAGRGKLERGAVADLVIWTGDPFELASRAEAVFIGGVRQSLRTRQTLLLERYRRVPAATPPVRH